MRSTYTVWDRSAALNTAVGVGLSALAAVVIAVLADRVLVAAVVMPVLAMVAVGRARSAGRVLALSESGIVLRGSTTSWQHVERVGVGTEAVEVVLHPDAPLPGWMSSRISDPADPADRLRLREPVPGLDPTRFTAAVQALPSARHVLVGTAGPD